MTTATINFDQPTLFKEGRFTRDTPSAPGQDRTSTPPQPSNEPRTPAPRTNRSRVEPKRRTPAPTDRSPNEPAARAPSDRSPIEPLAPAERPGEPRSATADAHDPRGGLTLDDVLSAAWDGLAAHTSVTCPVCSGSMVPRYGSGPQPVGGRCKRCGSTLG
jgi:hypothetical protein